MYNNNDRCRMSYLFFGSNCKQIMGLNNFLIIVFLSKSQSANEGRGNGLKVIIFNTFKLKLFFPCILFMMERGKMITVLIFFSQLVQGEKKIKNSSRNFQMYNSISSAATKDKNQLWMTALPRLLTLQHSATQQALHLKKNKLSSYTQYI